MNRDVSEINVQQLRSALGQNGSQRFQLEAGNLPGLVEQLAKPKSPQEMSRRFAHEIDGFEGKPLRIFAFLRDDDGPDLLQRCDLPVDVKHLRFEKGRAI